MNEIYLICENVDLGYHVHEAYRDKTIAAERIKELNTIYRRDKTELLVTGCGYTWQQAEDYVAKCSDKFELDTTTLK